VTEQLSDIGAEKSVEISVETFQNLRRFAVAGRFAPTPVRSNKSLSIKELGKGAKIPRERQGSKQERSFFFHMDKSFWRLDLTAFERSVRGSGA
jgi:hypothetical protein